jgi:hypothetical protein
LLGKKYEEKYKQVAEVASKLTIEEATFRDIQVELYFSSVVMSRVISQSASLLECPNFTDKSSPVSLHIHGNK